MSEGSSELNRRNKKEIDLDLLETCFGCQVKRGDVPSDVKYEEGCRAYRLFVELSGEVPYLNCLAEIRREASEIANSFQ